MFSRELNNANTVKRMADFLGHHLRIMKKIILILAAMLTFAACTKEGDVIYQTAPADALSAKPLVGQAARHRHLRPQCRGRRQLQRPHLPECGAGCQGARPAYLDELIAGNAHFKGIMAQNTFGMTVKAVDAIMAEAKQGETVPAFYITRYNLGDDPEYESSESYRELYRADGTCSYYDLIDGQWVEEETVLSEYFADGPLFCFRWQKPGKELRRENWEIISCENGKMVNKAFLRHADGTTYTITAHLTKVLEKV